MHSKLVENYSSRRLVPVLSIGPAWDLLDVIHDEQDASKRVWCAAWVLLASDDVALTVVLL